MQLTKLQKQLDKLKLAKQFDDNCIEDDNKQFSNA